MREVTIGLHGFSFEPPDLARCVLQGDVSADEMRRMIACVRACAAERAPVMLVIDNTRAGAIPGDTRKEARDTADIPYGAIAIFGSDFRTKLVATMILGVMKLLSGERTPVAFFDTEAEALRWIDARRAALAHPGRRSARPPQG